MVTSSRPFDVEPVGRVRAGLGEGPCWDADAGSLLWVDIPGGDMHRTEPDAGATQTIHLGPPVSAVLPAAGGGLVVLRRDAVVVFEPDGAERTVARIDIPAELRFNDAKCDPHGRLWAGTMHTERVPGTAALYRLDPAGPREVIGGVTVSNGLGWSPDARRMYYIDTPTKRVDVFDYDIDGGEIANRRPLVDLTNHLGRPDGMTVDDDGCLWVSVIAGGELHRYTPDGRLDRVVPLPVSHSTSCAFGGSDGKDLFVTTAREPLTEKQRAEQPLAGALLRLRPGPSGPPAAHWAGV